MADIGIRISAVDDTRPAFDSVGRSLAGVQTGAAAANKAVAQMGVSAAQTAAAMRSVPAQFTDIVVGLQSGQAPLTVLLQQGGQLKDMFGGIGNAARALGGYITSLLTPLNLTIAAVGALGFAYYKGTQESSEYNKALILTGNAAGTTSGQMADMAANMARVGVSQGAAAQALAAFATTGQIAAASMEKFSLAAVKYASATGIAVEDTVKQFVELGKAPLEASVKLDESANHLTLTLYEQIKALDAQGRHTEAATLAQNTFADTLSSRSAEMVSKLGLIERAWAGIKKEVSEVVNFAAGIGRDTGLGEQVNAQQLRVTNAQNNLNYVQRSGFGAAKVQAYQDELQVERDKLEVLRETARMVSRSAAARAQEVKSVKDQIEFDKEAAKYKTNAVKLQEELNRLAEKYAQVTHDGELGARNTAAYKVAVEKVRDQYKDKDVPKKIVDLGTYDSLIRSIREKIEVQEQELTGVEKLTKGEREQAKFLADLRDGTTGLVALRGKSIQQQAAEIVQAHQTNIALEKQNEVIAQAAAMRESAARAFDAYNKKQADETAAIIARAQSVEDEVAAYGLTKEALRQLTIARLEEQAAQITRFEPADVAQREVAAIEERIAALKRLGAAETSLAAKDAAAKAASHAEQEWKRAAGRINDSITDALMRGFESGKGFAENLRDTVVNMFKTMVLRPTVSAIVNPVAQGVTGMLGMSGTANAAGGMSQLGGALGTLTLGGSTIAAIGSSVATGISAGLAGTSLTGATAAYSAAGMSGVAGGLGFGSAIGSGLAAIGPVGWAALAALAAVQLFKGNGGTPTANTGNASASYDRLGNRTDYQTYYGGSSAAVDKMLASLQDSYTKAAQALGIGAAATRFSYGGNTGKNGESPNFALGGGAGSVNFYQGETTSSDAAIALAAQRAVFAALQGSDLPQYLARMFDGLSASNMTQEQIAGTLAYAQSVKQVREALLETREPLQILKDNVAAGMAALSTSSETFKTDFVAAIDAGISPEKLAQWQGLQNAMTELAAASGKASDSVKDVSRSIADIANERQRLQDQLDDLTMTSTELLAKQRAAIDASNRSLFDQVQAAQTARNTLDQRNALEEQLLQLQGNTAELRRRELESIEPSNRALQASIYALQDAKDAQDAYNTALSNAQGRLASATAALESAQNAVDAIRNSGTDQYLSALQQVAQAQDAIASAAQQATQKMAQLGQSLRDFVTREVLSSAAGTPSIAAANASFARTLAQAKGGNADAIAELESKGRIAIDAARAGSTSSAQFQAIRNAVLQGVSGVAATLPNATQAQGADLQQRLIDAQTDLAEALRVANAIGAPLQRQQADLIAKFGTAQSALASAQAEYAAASAVLEAIKTNTAQTAANVLDLNGNLVVQLHASAQSEITKLIKVIGDDTGLAPDLKVLAMMGTESVSKTIDLIATADITPDLKALALASSSAVVKTIGVVVSSSLSGDDKALALMVSDSVAKNIALAATSNLAPDLKTLALLENGSIAKYISLVANSSLSPDDKNLALMASSSVTKTIGAALGSLDATALSIALAQSDTLTRTISAVGGTLTADQRTVLQALSGASSVSVNVSGTTTANVMFDPADPIRSVWTAIQNSSAANAAYAYGIHSAISWIGSMVSNMLNHVNTVQVVFNRGDGNVFAKGGVFTNRVVDQPTTFDQGLMGEAGPEAIMPLRRGPDGSLGVVAAIDYRQFGRGNDALVAEIRTLREENRAQASAIVNLNQRMTKLFERWDGNGLPSTRVEA